MASRSGTYGSISTEKKGAASSKTTKKRKKSRSKERKKKESIKKKPEEPLITERHEKKPSEKLYFADGKRRIDYVLVWEEVIDGPPVDQQLLYRRENSRREFMKSLANVPLEMEEAVLEKGKLFIHFVKIHVPWEIMCKYAEELEFRAPLLGHQNPTTDFTAQIFKKIHFPNPMNNPVPNHPLHYTTCTFRANKLEKYLGNENHDTYFTSTQRQQAAYEILATQLYGKRENAEVGIDRLVQEEAFIAAYPLHEGTYELPVPTGRGSRASAPQLNNRQVLYDYWANYLKFFKYQPLDLIREYYGEKIALYFAWLGLYTAWLFPAAMVGLGVFLYGYFTVKNYYPANEICRSNKTYRMCPSCDESAGCTYWYLSDICFYAKWTYVLDNPATMFFAVFISFWAVLFLESWKRKNAELSYKWETWDYEGEEEKPRPEFASLCSRQEVNPVTGALEPHFPTETRIPRIAIGVTFILMMIAVVIIFIIAIITYRVLIAIPFFKNSVISSRAALFASLSAAILNFIVILVLEEIYNVLALKLNQWEMYRTQTEFENALVLKVFIFQFINYYSSIFYIAFFKGRFIGYPGNYSRFFGMRNEECSNSNCFMELAQQLAIIMIGKQIVSNFNELLIPRLKTIYHRLKTGLSIIQNTDGDGKQWEEDFHLIDYEGLLDEYMEMVLQFGFVTIFVASFPLAPLFAMLNNWIEIRLDAKKLVCHTRRPVAERAKSIGVWFTILDSLTQIAIISNAFVIALTSEFLQRLVYQIYYEPKLHGYVNFTLAHSPLNSTTSSCRYRSYRDETGKFTSFYWYLLTVRLIFVIGFEHIVFFLARIMDLMIPDVPREIEIAVKKNRYQAKLALQERVERRGNTNPAIQITY